MNETDGKDRALLQNENLHNFRTQLCAKLKAGKCANPDWCAHSHCITWQRRNPMKYLYLSILCPDIEFVKSMNRMHLIRRCEMGRHCLYAHSKEEQLYHPMAYKVRMCKTHGTCVRRYCPFAHSTLELRKALSTAQYFEVVRRYWEDKTKSGALINLCGSLDDSVLVALLKAEKAALVRKNGAQRSRDASGGCEHSVRAACSHGADALESRAQLGHESVDALHVPLDFSVFGARGGDPPIAPAVLAAFCREAMESPRGVAQFPYEARGSGDDCFEQLKGESTRPGDYSLNRYTSTRVTSARSSVGDSGSKPPHAFGSPSMDCEFNVFLQEIEHFLSSAIKQ